MREERSATEAAIIKQICLLLSDNQRSIIKNDDISLIACKISNGETSIEYVRSLLPDDLFDFMIGQMRLF